jgi:hypothetical protein
MSDFWHRGFRLSIFIRRSRDMWEVTTTIYAPDDLAHELGDRITMDVMRLPTNRIEQVRAEALDRAKVAVNDIVNRRNQAVQPPRTAP